jgi:hypothetical protein
MTRYWIDQEQRPANTPAVNSITAELFAADGLWTRWRGWRRRLAEARANARPLHRWE